MTGTGVGDSRPGPAHQDDRGPEHRPEPRGTLLVGVGNTLAGDDGVGARVAERLARDPRLPDDVEVVQAGTDLLRVQQLLRGRTRLVIVDALLDDGPPGRLVAVHSADGLDDRAGSAHHLSPAHAIRLLQAAQPGLRELPVTFLCVTVRDSRLAPGLSPELARRLDVLVDEAVSTLHTLDRPEPHDRTDPRAAEEGGALQHLPRP